MPRRRHHSGHGHKPAIEGVGVQSKKYNCSQRSQLAVLKGGQVTNLILRRVEVANHAKSLSLLAEERKGRSLRWRGTTFLLIFEVTDKRSC